MQVTQGVEQKGKGCEGFGENLECVESKGLQGYVDYGVTIFWLHY